MDHTYLNGHTKKQHKSSYPQVGLNSGPRDQGTTGNQKFMEF